MEHMEMIGHRPQANQIMLTILPQEASSLLIINGNVTQSLFDKT